MRFSLLHPASLVGLLASLPLLGPGCLGPSGDAPAGGTASPTPAPAEVALRVRFPARAPALLDEGDALVATGEGFGPASSIGSTTGLRDGLGVTLPPDGSGAVRFALPDGFAVGVREQGVTGEGATAGHAVAYERAGGASYWTATADGYEEWLRLDEGAATPDHAAAAWEIDGAAPVQVGSWVELRSGEGTTRLRVTAPVAYAASGRQVEARLAVRGSAIELWVDGGGEAVLVDPQWTAAATMASPHAFHTGTLLQSGEVLVASGYTTGGTATTACEIYNPAANSWTTVGPVGTACVGQVAALLANGEVLIAGGLSSSVCIANAELYNPATATWTAVASMSSARCAPTGVLLPSGNVLVAGGENASDIATATAEVYNPATSTWSLTGAMTVARIAPSSVVLANGTVLVAGGLSFNGTTFVGIASAEVYNPSTNAWTAVGSMATARGDLTLTLLPNGTALAAGGTTNGTTAVASAELYNPSTNAWTAAGAMTAAREYFTATLLGSGQVLAAGGSPDGTTSLATAELYNPATNTWTATASLNDARYAHSANLLATGVVLAAGGFTSSAETNTAELFGGTGVLGSACSLGSNCASGFCVDSVCCNTACNGGVCDACSVAAGAATNGTCAPLTGTACNDGNACTQTDTCQSGVCVGSNPVVCPAPTTCQQSDTCNPATGQCTVVPSVNGTACSTGNACVTGQTCEAGACSGGSAVTCTALDQCHTAGVCNPASGCPNPTKTDGTACNDGNACDMNDVCVSGVCTAGTTVTCPTADQCHQPSTCNPANGTCSNVPKPNGTACNDGTACTTGETCQAGACTGGTPVTCTAMDQCHTAGVCSPTTGMCSNPTVTDGTACNDNNLCTQTDVCMAGVCSGTNPVVCPVADQCHQPSTCNPANGTCSNVPKANGTACNAGTGCTMGDACESGVCTAGSPVVCMPLDQCHVAGVCSPATGTCSNPAVADGTACNDNDLCTQTDTCMAGVCTGTNPVMCPPPADACHGAGVCAPATGACSNPTLPDGTTCPGGACMAGECVPEAGTTSSSSTTSSSTTSSSGTTSSSSGTGGSSTTTASSGTGGSGGTTSSSGTGGSGGGTITNGSGGGTTTSSSSGGSTSTGAGAGGSGGGGGSPGSSGGCGCREAPAPASGGLWLGLGLLIAARRRASRRERTPRAISAPS